MYRLSDYQYELPDSLIAQTPAHPVDNSKLLVPDGTWFHDHHFYDIVKLLTSHDVLFFNDTKVIKARVPLHNVLIEIPHHPSASKVLEEGEIFFLEMVDPYRFEWLASLNKRVRKWSIIHMSHNIKLIVEDLTDKWILFHVRGVDVLFFFESFGQMPLPPYISYDDTKAEHYQTIFADKIGSVAAPTASLHFTHDLIDSLHTSWVSTYYLTLHVGLGTFKPVDTDDIREYHIHEETIVIDESMFDTIAQEKLQWKNIIAVGTTVARTIETLPYLYRAKSKDQRAESHPETIQNKEYWEGVTGTITDEECTKYILSWKQSWTKIVCQTRIFIYPWFEWKIVDGLITNFHLPWSTLLMLVASFIGYEHVMKLYEYAVQHAYRFFSFWDAMLLRRNK